LENPGKVAVSTPGYATNLASPTGWGAVSPGPVTIDGQNIVTNEITGSQQFFRLKSN